MYNAVHFGDLYLQKLSCDLANLSWQQLLEFCGLSSAAGHKSQAQSSYVQCRRVK